MGKVGILKSFITFPIVINGDIVDQTSMQSALKLSGADHIMVGQGALGILNLGKVVGSNIGSSQSTQKCDWQIVLSAILQFMQTRPLFGNRPDLYHASRCKQWFSQYLQHHYPQAKQFFDHNKTLNNNDFLKAISDLK